MVAVLLLVMSAWTPSRPASARLSTSAPPAQFAPTYYRPVIIGGKAFPLARSNFLSLIEIHHNWHALRLRLIGGKWLPVGVHEGIDISAERGTPILSMTPGVVENVGWTFYSGTRVGVRGTDGGYYFYAHLSAVAPGLQVGGRVVAGQMLGRVGNTGYGLPGERDQFPPHLHFGIMVGSTWVNPHPALVSLYEATVAADARARGHMDDLAAGGRWGPWQQAATRTFTSFGS
jgi:murein DD-endopeptidase MepM/ murein hydrolase activator NlpD